MDVERVVVTHTIANSGPFPRLIDAFGDVPDRNAPIVAPCHIYLVALERCNSRGEDEVIVGLPSVNVFMACIENLVEVDFSAFSLHAQRLERETTFALPLDPPLKKRP